MFGRRRHVAPAVVAPAPQLTEDVIFDIVHAQIAAAIGEHGEWTLTRREATDTDGLFYGVIAHSVTTHVVEALRIARENLAVVRPALLETERAGDHVANAAPAANDIIEEPAAFGWRPAPITVWTDLKRPVTGPIAHIDEHELVA
ncbi:MAG: hypothetical protein EPN48_01995 [Microbacteriaceae bacterium]|nr:MAG: hypothetical protein EPN48_01995 [Microbacteriaceae bacterium]